MVRDLRIICALLVFAACVILVACGEDKKPMNKPAPFEIVNPPDLWALIYDLESDTCPWENKQHANEVAPLPPELPYVSEGWNFDAYCTWQYYLTLDGVISVDTFFGDIFLRYDMDCRDETPYECEVHYKMRGMRQ